MLKNLNFFRIWFTITILYGHIVQHFMVPYFSYLPVFQYLSTRVSYAFGYMCDMFFILSGFFMFFSFAKKPTFKNFIVSKLARIWPVLIFSLFGFIILSNVIDDVHFFKYDNILSFFLIRSAFLTQINTNNGAAWYINVMFWGYIFYFCFFKIVSPEKRKYATGLLVFFLYSLLINKLALYDQPQVFLDGILTVPMARAIAGIGLGYLFAEIYNDSKDSVLNNNTENNKKSRIFYTVVECVTIIFLFEFSIIKWLNFAFPVLLLLFIILFACFLKKKGYISRLLDNDIIFNLGKYCFSFYMMQDFCFQILYKYLWKNPVYGVNNYPVLNVILGIAFCIATGILTYYIVEIPFRKIISKYFIDKNID